MKSETTNHAGAVAMLLRWIARILSAGLLLFVLLYAAAYFLGGAESTPRPLMGRDFLAIAAGLALLAGFALAWRWEVPGGIVALAAYGLLALLNPAVLSFPAILILVVIGLFVVSGWLHRRMPRPRIAG